MSAALGSPRVAALLPAWNAGAFIDQTLKSLAAQTYANLDVIISDDASTDGTSEICTRFAASHPRFQFIRQAKRLGWIGNVNALLREARADYLFFAFHDDPLNPPYVARLAASLESNPRAVLAFSDIELGSGVRSYTALDGVSERLERGRRIIRKQGLWWIPNRGLFRSDTAAQIGGMHKHLAGEYSADWPWLLHLALLGEFVRTPQPLIRKVWRTTGVSMLWKGTPWQAFGVAAACAREIARSGIPISEQVTLFRELGVRGTQGLLSRLG